MSLTSRRPRPLKRQASEFRDCRLIVIATEGKEREPRYLEALRGRNHRVHIKILATEDDGSSPKSVLARLKKFKKEYQIGSEDSLWLVLDFDRWPIADLSRVSSEAKSSGFNLAVSHPCFEIWLLLHLVTEAAISDIQYSTQAKQRLDKEIAAKRIGNIYESSFIDCAGIACERAEKLDTQPDSPWPTSVGTRVYRLVRELINKKAL